MKTITIVTLIKAHNYGAILQAYALQEFLENKKYNVQFLNYKDNFVIKNYKPIKFNGNKIKIKIKSLIRSIYYYKLNRKHYNKFNCFINRNIHLYPQKEQNINYFLNYNSSQVLITGSDQVWNPEITGDLSDIYTLNFGKEKIKRISYAASLGNTKVNNNLKEQYQEKLKKIDKISVREKSGREILQEIFPHKKIEVVFDPTLLVTKEEWDNKTTEMQKEEEKYILAYAVEKDDEFTKITNEISKKTGYKVIHFGLKNKGLENVLRSAYTDGPLEFVNLIKNAEYIVATSFHATVFSIIFNKKFWIIPHKKTGSRVTDLLEKLDISDRAVDSLEEFKNKNFNAEINYKKVNERLKIERQKSIDWLIDAIEK